MTKPQRTRRDQLIRIAKWTIRATVLGLVFWGVGRTLHKGWQDVQNERERLRARLAEVESQLAALDPQEPAVAARRTELIEQQQDLREQYAAAERLSLREIRPGWLLASAGFYLLGNLPSGWFWYRALQRMGQQPRLGETLRAFYIGHLGKYVPGKAMVVILRTGLIRSPRVDTTVAATSVFVETLTMMAVGALVAAALLASLYREHERLLGLAVLLMLLAGVPTIPPIFRRIVRLLQVSRASAQVEQALEGLDYRLMAFGWLILIPSWALLGMSLWAVLEALPSAPAIALAEELPRLTACVALAIVAGFLSLIPGGVGVREGVVMTFLAGPYGAFTAAISAILLRLVWLLAELVISGILYISGRQKVARVASAIP